MKPDTIEVTPQTAVKEVTIRFEDGHTETYAPVVGKSGVVVGVFEQDKEDGVRRTMKHLEGRTPGLVVIDGGKGLMEGARGAMQGIGMTADLIGVAKKPDRAFLPDGTIVDLEDRSHSSLLLKRIRDEVHRFAIGFHRKLRDRRLMVSALEEIPGVGKKRRLELLRHFGSIEGVRQASVDEIARVKGLNRKVAALVAASVKKDGKN